MRILFTVLLITIFSNLSYGQSKKDIIIGKRFTIKSEILNSDREISIYLPNSYNNNDYVNYPVIYLLDGRKFFHPFTGAVTQMSSDASPQIPEMIVVGITSQDRLKDSSPTRSMIGYSGKEEKGLEISGGANDFIKFIEKELIPYIDNNYRTNNYRIFSGYSFTGLPILHALFTKPELFNSYLVIDFSAWWDNEVSLKNLEKFFKEYNGTYKDVYIATVDRVENTVYPEKANLTWRFIQKFEQLHPYNIGLGYKKYGYKEENHHTMPLVSFMDGMKYLFRGHMINYDEMYTNPTLIKKRFDKLSDRLGYKIFLREDLANYFGYQFLYTLKDLDKAFFYFKYNTENYPSSSNAWDSFAEFYMVKGDKKKAIEYYEKALELNTKNTDIKKRLEELKN
ncbi:alpha/beta hydrolase-fold protein [Tenacibaculum sp. Ill]|uniref:alpha/beta hydrolase-fold protein n=1 Tax=Tenacibaculum sp. Ill TaxID=3445935 RepID=UPI003F7ABCC8